MLCGAKKPVSHVKVWNTDGVTIGRVCASHTLHQIVQDGQGRFCVEVIFYYEDER